MQFYAARQPILDVNKELFAYEVLFRESLENVFPDVGDDEATSRIISDLQLNLGLENLTGDKPAFINFSEDNLLKLYPSLLPKEQIVVEILETVRPTKELLAACKKLKQKGYVLALDDFEHSDAWKQFYPLIDLIKVDLRAIDEKGIQLIKDVIKPFPKIKLLAEKVETHEEFADAVAQGFDYFQGYFFSAPEVVQSKALEPSQVQLSELLVETAKETVDVEKITSVFERDVNLSFKLLRYSNSAAFKRRSEIASIKQAIVVLGSKELKKFLSVLFAANVGTGKPAELIRMSLVRAQFCEFLCQSDNQCGDNSKAFLAGMMSLIDAILDQSIESLMEKLPLAQEIKDALIKQTGRLAIYIKVISCYERAQWEQAEALTKKLNVDSENLPALYKIATQWANEMV